MRSIITAIAAMAVFALNGAAAEAAVTVSIPPATPTTVAAYATVLHRINPQLPSWQSRYLARRVLNNAAHWRVDPNLLVALVTVESRWHTHAVSPVGAIGLGQLMPGTAADLHVDPDNPAQNLAGAARYLRGLLDRYRYKANRLALACAAYNAGPKAVSEYGGIPPYQETQNYVVRVLDTLHVIASSIHLPKFKHRAVAKIDLAPDVAFWSGH